MNYLIKQVDTVRGWLENVDDRVTVLERKVASLHGPFDNVDEPFIDWNHYIGKPVWAAREPDDALPLNWTLGVLEQYPAHPTCPFKVVTGLIGQGWDFYSHCKPYISGETPE